MATHAELTSELRKFFTDAQVWYPARDQKPIRVNGCTQLSEEDILNSTLSEMPRVFLTEGYRRDAGNMMVNIILHEVRNNKTGEAHLELSGNRRRQGLEIHHFFGKHNAPPTRVIPNFGHTNLGIVKTFVERPLDTQLIDAFALMALARKAIGLDLDNG